MRRPGSTTSRPRARSRNDGDGAPTLTGTFTAPRGGAAGLGAARRPTGCDAVIDRATAAGLAPATHARELTEAGAGTPMGELLRRYWHPIGLAADAGSTPRPVRVLGEDLILFRD